MLHGHVFGSKLRIWRQGPTDVMLKADSGVDLLTGRLCVDPSTDRLLIVEPENGLRLSGLHELQRN